MNNVPRRRDHHDLFTLLTLQRDLSVQAIDFRLHQFPRCSRRILDFSCGHRLALFGETQE